MPPDLSIIIVNWNSAEYLSHCLGSIFCNAGGLNFEVLVADNGSYDGCAEMLAQCFPQVHFLQLPRNLGFAAANDLAFAFSTGSNLLFLNPDTEVVGHALPLMLETLAVAPHAGIIGPRLVGPDFSPQWNCMRCVPTILNQLLDSSFSRRAFPGQWGFDVVARESHSPVSVQVVPGTCLMVRRDVFAQAGLFNRDYFMYVEDVDLCCQARKLGWKTYYAHDAVVIHHGAASSRRQEYSAFSAVLMRESVKKFFSATRGRFYAASYRASTGLAALCRLLLGGAVWLVADRAQRPQWRAATTKWVRVLRWSLGLEPWARTLSAAETRLTPDIAPSPATSPAQKLSA
ncbi:MAG TPA: glycosyltransferase family 2 protein [Terriglobales bacterium]